MKYFAIFLIFIQSFALTFTKKEQNTINKYKNRSLYIGIGQTWEPFVFLDENNKTYGYEQDIIDIINKKTGLNLKLYPGDWQQVQEYAKKGKIEGIACAADIASRKEWGIKTLPYNYLQKYIIIKIGNPLNIENLSDLKGKKVGYISSNLLEKELASRLNTQTTGYKTPHSLIKALIENKIDAIIGNDATLWIAYKEGYPFSIEFGPKIGGKTPLSYWINKKYSSLIPVLNKAIKDIPKEKLTSIHSKWFVNFNIKNNDFLLTPKEKEYLKNKKTITYCVDPNWMPFEAIINGKINGITKDFIQVFEKKLGVKFKLIPTKDWTETIKFAKKGRCDILTMITPSQKRKSFLNFTAPYIVSKAVLITKPNKIFRDNLYGINKKIAIVKGYLIINRLRKKYPNLKIVEVNSISDGLNKILQGKVWGYIDSSITANREIQYNYKGKLAITGILNQNFELSVGVKKDEKKLLTIMQKTLNSIDPKTKQKILNKWIQKPTYIINTNYKIITAILIILILVISVAYFWIKKLKLLNKNIQEAKEKAEEAINIKSRFLANVTHELKTPLNAIIGFSTLGIKSDDLSKNRAFFKKIHISGQHLNEIITNILDLSKAESSKISFEIKKVNLSDILHETGAILSLKADEKGLLFKIENSLKHNTYMTDPLRIKQILINLGNNAIKFTDKGEVKIKAYENDGNVVFEVTDTGIGIKKEEIKEIFKEFYQINNNKMTEGTGLGLAITKKIIDEMKGTIEVNSEPDKGTEFKVSLPIQITEHSEKKETKTDTKFAFANKKVLVVDDNELNREIAAAYLKEINFDVDTAENGHEAIEKAKSNKYDIIFMDIKMPGMDGIETAKHIRKFDKTTPIFALTASSEKEKCEIFNEYLKKPIELEKFYNAIKKYIKTNITSKSINFEVGQKYCLNEELYTKILKNFLNKYSNFDLNTIEDRIIFFHTLKSAARTIGAERLGEYAAKLEKEENKEILNKFKKELAEVIKNIKSRINNQTR